MPSTVIENPILNSPFREPTRHFRFTEDGISDEIVEGRRESGHFLPIARPRQKGASLSFETHWTADRHQPTELVNRIRQRISQWRSGGYAGVTPITARLLGYWSDPARDKPLFFCQIEAVETAIYVTEVAHKFGDSWIANQLRQENDLFNPGLPRVAFKMATGTGKTVVMAMLIAWQALNKLASRQDARFSDNFLIVTPGITIRDRLRVLLPSDPDNYYRQRDVVSPELLEQLGQARFLITNFHAFVLHERGDASRLTKSILTGGRGGVFTETPDQMVSRVCRDLGRSKGEIVVINDEAHHCYRGKPDDEIPTGEKLDRDERAEADRRAKDARVWISGLEAIQRKLGVKTIYDLSATPFFLKGSGYGEGTLFPWVVSDFSLIDAIEAGLVKIPRVPVADDSMTGELPTYRDIWARVRESLPRTGRKGDTTAAEPNLPVELEGALTSLYGNYEKWHRLWQQSDVARARGHTPPVFIVVCSNTRVSKMVFDWIAGWEKPLPDGSTVVVPGHLDLFSNELDGRWTARPNTILVDSEQLESGEGMSPEFKKIATVEIEEFKAEYRVRFPGRDADDLTDEDILREVMNTVGKPGKLGEHVRCVVSVSMLTEGWDANTVTHVLGVRAFGTQLLCEQVVGRALRRMSYAINDQGRFDPEYAEVYGVPFSFIPCSGSTAEPKPGPQATRVRALEDRIACEITFPRIQGYRFEIAAERLTAHFGDDAKLTLSTADVPTETRNEPIVGEGSDHDLDELRRRRPNEVAFQLAKLLLQRHFRDSDGHDRPWLFPQLLAISKRWLAECVTCKDKTFPQMVLLARVAHHAAEKIYRCIVQSTDAPTTLKAIPQPYDTLGSTRWVDFDTTRPVYATRSDKCHVSHVVADTESWEQKTAQAIEDMPEVACYVKNHGLNFTIPYTLEGEERHYFPDFVVRIDDGHGPDDLLNLLIETSGERRKDKAAKVATARTLWVPAVNAHGGFGRWAFLEIFDPWDTQNTIRAALTSTMVIRTRPFLAVERAALAGLCRRNHITRLALFGSVLRDDFRPESDIDVLARFETGHRIGFGIVEIEEELSRLLGGRRIDLVSEEFLNPRLRDRILASTRELYAER